METQNMRKLSDIIGTPRWTDIRSVFDSESIVKLILRAALKPYLSEEGKTRYRWTYLTRPQYFSKTNESWQLSPPSSWPTHRLSFVVLAALDPRFGVHQLGNRLPKDDTQAVIAYFLPGRMVSGQRKRDFARATAESHLQRFTTPLPDVTFPPAPKDLVTRNLTEYGVTEPTPPPPSGTRGELNADGDLKRGPVLSLKVAFVAIAIRLCWTFEDWNLFAMFPLWWYFSKLSKKWITRNIIVSKVDLKFQKMIYQEIFPVSK